MSQTPFVSRDVARSGDLSFWRLRVALSLLFFSLRFGWRLWRIAEIAAFSTRPSMWVVTDLPKLAGFPCFLVCAAAMGFVARGRRFSEIRAIVLGYMGARPLRY